MANLVHRMVRAARLDSSVYEEVEADRGATGQAALVVVISSLAAGVGALRNGGTAAPEYSGLIFFTLAALLGWTIWALMTYLIGTRLLPEPQTQADLGQMLRTIGFSSSPGVLRVLGIVPGLQLISALVASVWMLIAMVIAVRQALDYKSTARAVSVCVIGWLIQLIILFAFGPLTSQAR